MARKLELRRQAMHLGLGIFLLLLLLALGRMKLIYFLCGTLFFGFLLISFVVRGRRVPVASWFVETFERPGVPLPGYGSAWYVMGFLICALMVSEVSSLAAAIFVLAVGDAASNLAGSLGRFHLPYNRAKTIEGTLAFVLSSLPAFAFIGWGAIPLAVIAALVESLPAKIDDNLTIALACSIFFRIFS